MRKYESDIMDAFQYCIAASAPVDYTDTLKQLVKALEAGGYSQHPSPMTLTPLDFGGNYSISPPNECAHEWTEYVGYSEAFTFCKKCDKRKV
jgi:hypothetical protein